MNVKPTKPRQFEEKSSNWKTEGSATSPWQRLGRQSERLLPVEPTCQARELCYSTNPTCYASYAMKPWSQSSFQNFNCNNCDQRRKETTLRWCAILCGQPLGIRINVAQLITLLWFRHGLTINPFRPRLNSKTNWALWCWAVMYLPSLLSILFFSMNTECHLLEAWILWISRKLFLLWATDFMMSNIACKCRWTCTSDLAR